MRPMFADAIVSEAGIDLDGSDPREAAGSEVGPDRSRAYLEWRRTRVLFMHSVSEAERAVVHDPADLAAQRRETHL